MLLGPVTFSKKAHAVHIGSPSPRPSSCTAQRVRLRLCQGRVLDDAPSVQAGEGNLRTFEVLSHIWHGNEPGDFICLLAGMSTGKQTL